uniref:Uncharacterized protein n=1 Tax=Oryza glumipatula TaxID=40148 RepID=A0A0D9ZNV2_9ORYZ
MPQTAISSCRGSVSPVSHFISNLSCIAKPTISPSSTKCDASAIFRPIIAADKPPAPPELEAETSAGRIPSCSFAAESSRSLSRVLHRRLESANQAPKLAPWRKKPWPERKAYSSAASSRSKATSRTWSTQASASGSLPWRESTKRRKARRSSRSRAAASMPERTPAREESLTAAGPDSAAATFAESVTAIISAMASVASRSFDMAGWVRKGGE